MKKQIIGALKSRVFWFNAITGTLEIVNLLNGTIIPHEAAAAIVAIGNIALRFVTTKPLSEK